jgi:hypothetical protein
MSPRLVPAARGGATGKALAVGAAQHSGGAEGARISAAGITSRPGEEASCDPRHKRRNDAPVRLICSRCVEPLRHAVPQTA